MAEQPQLDPERYKVGDVTTVTGKPKISVLVPDDGALWPAGGCYSACF
jgi:hypothetical protein